ncbi:hypothetical protein NIES2100_67230 [Calothrix sp. NIES-2100]|uniref:hypothetical protein n=1 Tax=Calothrix sp. NIES-2100 TaxID=1954172 RepID=UPI000B622EBB|nr:hypothetical protein NIES2100_67230 [Calothrix sp. NIES-2100]
MTISISDLSPVTSDSLLESVDQEEGGVIKSAVARALEARKIVGGTTISNVKLKPEILCPPPKPIITGKIAPSYCPPPIIVGKIACPPITIGLIAVDPTASLA